MKLAPILLIVYNRLEHTKNTIEALKKNKSAIDSELFIFSDAAKNEEDFESVKLVREYIKTVKDGFKKVTVIEYEENNGVLNATDKAIRIISKNYDSFIGLEDDIETNSDFLSFMNQALEYYKDSKEVMLITGFTHENIMKKVSRFQNIEEDVIFSYAFHSWGWASWKDRWADINIKNIDSSWYRKNVKHYLKGAIMSWFHLLAINKASKNKDRTSLWDIRLSFLMYKNKKVCVWPSKHSYTNNIGFDGSGIHKYYFTHDSLNFSKKENKEEIKFSDNIKVKKRLGLCIGMMIGINVWVKNLVATFLKKYSTGNIVIYK